MKTILWLVAVPIAMLASQVALAQAPGGSTGQCKDGTYTNAANKGGACRGHQGIQAWFAATPAAPATPAKPSATLPAAATSTAAPSAPTAAAPPAPTARRTAASGSERKDPAAAASRPEAPGGGPGMVWVNTASKVYHCSGTTFYGKTKDGKYMSEADAKAMGAHADHNKACTK